MITQICVQCGASFETTSRCFKRCPGPCRDKGTYNRTKRYVAKRKAANICVYCGGPGPDGCCAACRTNLARLARERMQEYARKGCAVCGREASIPANPRYKILSKKSRKYCRDCYLKEYSERHFKTRKLWEKLGEMLEAQKSTCAYTGLPIELGKTASLDHKIPPKRGGSISIENTHWVHMSINTMKHEMLHDEFLEMCSLVLKHQAISLPSPENKSEELCHPTEQKPY